MSFPQPTLRRPARARCHSPTVTAGEIAFSLGLFGLVNAIIRPVILLLTLPLTIVTLGLFILVVNALMLMLVAAVIPGFTLGGFWTAFWAAIFIAIVSFVTNRLIGKP